MQLRTNALAPRRLAITALVLMLSLLAIPVHGQGGYVLPPGNGQCWLSWSNVELSTNWFGMYVGSGDYQLYVFTPDQYAQWVGGNTAWAVYVGYVGPGLSTVSVSPGNYMVVLYPTPCGGSVNARLVVPSFMPVGISSFGNLTASALVSYFNITSVSTVGLKPIALTMSAVLDVEMVGGSTQYFLVRESLVISPGPSSLALEVEVIGINEPYVGNYGPLYIGTYSLPLAGYLVLNTSSADGFATVMVGYAIVQSGNYEAPMINWVYNVTLSDNALSVYITTLGGEALQGGYVGDAELVFTGYNGGVAAYSLNAELDMLYLSNGSWKPVGDVYGFGINTPGYLSNAGTVYMNNNAYVLSGVGGDSFIASELSGQVPTTYLVLHTYNGTLSMYLMDKPITISIPSVVGVGYGEELRLLGIKVNGSDYSVVVDGDNVTVMPRLFGIVNVYAEYETYAMLSISSKYPVNITINGITVNTDHYLDWLPLGTTVHVSAQIKQLSPGSRAVPINGTFTLSLNSPLNITISWYMQYLLCVNSTYAVKLIINNTNYNITNYCTWLNNGTQVTVEARPQVLSNSTMLKPTINSTSLVVQEPMNLTINWQVDYLLGVSSDYPVTLIINGRAQATVGNATVWVPGGSIVELNAATHYFNGTSRAVPLNGNETVVMGMPINVTVNWVFEDLINISSNYPVVVEYGNNSLNITSTSMWVPVNSQLVIRAYTHYVAWGVRAVPNVTVVEVTVYRPMNITIRWVKQYLVVIISRLPGVPSNTTWVNANSTITLRLPYELPYALSTSLSLPPYIIAVNNETLSAHPGVYEVYVTGPMRLVIMPSNNWVYLPLLISIVALLIVGLFSLLRYLRHCH